MNLGAIRRQMLRIRARLDANGAGGQFNIPRHGGMRALKDAIEAVRASREGRGEAKREAPLGMLLSPFHALRQAILQERAEREARGPEAYADTPAIYDDIEEVGKCTVAPISKQDT